MREIRWGIISTGRMSDWFCSDFGSVPGSTLHAVSSRSEEAAKAFADRYKIPKFYTSLDDMLADDEIDIVYISTPHTTHKAIALKALAARKPVICEKPFVTSVADAEDVIAAAREYDTYFVEAMWTWHLPAMRKARQWVDEGRIGKLVHVKTDFGYPIPYSPDMREYDANDAGGALREMGIYPVAISRLFINRDPGTVYVTHQQAPNGVEMDLTAIQDYGDQTSTIGTSFRCRLRNAAHIIGEEGYIVLPDAFRAEKAMLYKIDDLVEEADFSRSERGYHYQAINVAEDIREGRKESDIVPMSVSLSVQQDMKRILDKTGRGEH